jgi:predicted metal-dependent enzyme (double-stranded beta helix superfamily)
MKPENRLLSFVVAMTRLVEGGPADEAQLIRGATPLMQALVAHDDWLPEAMAAGDPQRYQQHLLYGDPLDRFSLVSFVWGPGQQTPVHDHTVWGIIGILRGREWTQRYAHDEAGRLAPSGSVITLLPGALDIVSPRLGDVHVVGNGLSDQASISIHLYGANIGRVTRHVFTPETGAVKDFVSGYSNALAPNLWA